MISTADDGTITLWNRQAETLFGWRPAEVLGKPLSNFVVPPEMREAHRAGLARAAATGTGALLGRRIEINAIDRAGRRFPVELSINRMPGPNGGFSAFLRDISDRRRVEA
ncbi:MAG: PAS domain S-box protein, partial [bacterium]